MGQNDWTIGAMENWTKSDDFHDASPQSRRGTMPSGAMVTGETQEFRPQRNLASYSRADFRTWLTDKKCREQLGKPSETGVLGQEGYLRIPKKTVILMIMMMEKNIIVFFLMKITSTVV